MRKMLIDNTKKRILIIGCPGSGKSTLALRLGVKLKLPVVHLDKEFWNAGWVETPRDKWRERVPELVTGEKWIVEGNYAGTLDLRLKHAETVIFLDFNRIFCLYSVILRVLKDKGRTRPDMADNCPEKVDLEFLFYIWNFNRDVRPKMLEQLKDFENLVTIRNRRQVNNLLEELD